MGLKAGEVAGGGRHTVTQVMPLLFCRASVCDPLYLPNVTLADPTELH